MTFTSNLPTSKAGKPIAVADQVSIVGNVTAIAGTGGTAVLTVNLPTSGLNVTVQGQDVYNNQNL